MLCFHKVKDTFKDVKDFRPDWKEVEQFWFMSIRGVGGVLSLPWNVEVALNYIDARWWWWLWAEQMLMQIVLLLVAALSGVGSGLDEGDYPILVRPLAGTRNSAPIVETPSDELGIITDDILWSIGLLILIQGAICFGRASSQQHRKC